MKLPRSFKALIPRILLLALSLLFSIIACEMLLRVVAPQPGMVAEINKEFYRIQSAPPYTTEQNLRAILVYPGDLKWSVFTDGSGYRVSDHPPREDKAKAPKVLVIGDSFTFGNAVDYEDTFVGLLNQSVECYQFINAGVGGYGPTQYREVLERSIGREPRPSIVIVVTYLGNDIYDCIWDKHPKAGELSLSRPHSVKSWVRKHSHLYRLCITSGTISARRCRR